MPRDSGEDITQSVLPNETPGDDYTHVSTSPEQFGGGVAQGAQQLAAGISTAGKFWGQIQTDGVQNDVNGQALELVKHYTSLKGQDALDAQQQTQTDLNKLYTDARGKLKMGDQLLAFDNQTRAFRQRFLEPQIYNHATQQGNAYATHVNNGSIDQGMALIAAHSDDEALSNHAIQMVLQGAGKNAHLALGNNASDEAVDAYMRPYLEKALKTRAEAMGVKSPKAALDFVEQNKDRMGVDYAVVSSQLRTRANEQEALGLVDGVMTDAAAAAQGGPQQSSAAVRQAILMQESGDKNKPATSADGAVGPGQIIPATFKEYAKPGEDITDPATNRAVSGRIVDDYSQRYNGDPQRIAVAYFSGPGNVAPEGSPTPWIKDVSDSTGKSVSSYVQDVNTRVSTQGAMLAARANVYDAVLAKTEGNPQLRDVALREVTHRYNAAQISSQQDQKARQDAQQTSLRKWGDVIRSGQSAGAPWQKDDTLTEEQVEHLDALAMAPKASGWGSGYADVQQHILNSDADGGIHNQEQLLSEFRKGNLTPGGYEQATKLLETVNKPGAEGEKVLTSNFYTSARKAVTLEYEGEAANAISEDRRQAWDKALPALNQAIEEGREKGYTSKDLMNPDGPHSIWPVLKPYLPTAAQKATSEINRDAGAAGKPFEWQNLSKMDDAVAAYNDHKITREQAKVLWDRNGWGKQTNGPQVPQGDTGGAEVRDLWAAPGSPNTDEAAWDKRSDGSQKGHGFLGLLRRPDGGVSSEISIGVEIGGKEVEIPTLVPTLTRPEIDALLSLKPEQKVPQEIVHKAIDFARQRLSGGKSPFAAPNESPDLKARKNG